MPAAPTPDDDYVLGTEPQELERLRHQHEVWVAEQRGLLARAGVGAGSAVLDLGCGPGFTSVEIARAVGPTGEVVACDRSRTFVRFLEAERERLDLPWIRPLAGRIEELDLPEREFDAAYARWFLCWLPDPGAVLERVARSLKPGGAVLVQDYVDWGAMKLLPPSPAFARGVAACLESWRRSGGHIDLVELLPDLAPRAGLAIEEIVPLAHLAPVGSPRWRWIAEFFAVYLPKAVGLGLLTQAELEAQQRDVAERERTGVGFCMTPTMVDVVLRKPAARA